MKRVRLKKTNSFDAKNVGFGLTYTLPILVAILSAPKGAIIIIENPEAHLHPGGISKLTELICTAAQSGIQIIIETHSDHIINGILVQIKKFKESDGELGVNVENVKLYQFEREEKDHSSVSISISLDSNGEIRYPPKGFFDQFRIDSHYLLLG